MKDKSLHQSIHVLYISRLGELVNAKYKTDNVSSKLHFFNERKKIKCGFRPCQRSHQMALGCHDPLYLVLPVWEAPECILLLLHGCTRSPPRLGVPLAIGLAVQASLPYRRHERCAPARTGSSSAPSSHFGPTLLSWDLCSDQACLSRSCSSHSRRCPCDWAENVVHRVG